MCIINILRFCDDASWFLSQLKSGRRLLFSQTTASKAVNFSCREDIVYGVYVFTVEITIFSTDFVIVGTKFK
jgi:hypothetical protein